MSRSSDRESALLREPGDQPPHAGAQAGADGQPGHHQRSGAVPSDGGDRLWIQPEGRPIEVVNDTPPDPRAVIEDLRRSLRAEQEKTLNSVDAVMGARAAAAQAKAETQEVFYRLHVRETELAQLKELLAESGVLDGRSNAPSPSAAARTLLSSVKRAVSDR